LICVNAGNFGQSHLHRLNPVEASPPGAAAGDRGWTMSIGDLIFNGAELLRSTRLAEFSLGLADSSFSLWLQSHFYAIPLFQTLHILGIAALFSSSLLLGLRVLGLSGRDQNLEAAYRRYRPWIWSSLAVIVLSGVILVVAEPVRNLTNPVFWTKMVLLVVGALGTLLLQSGIRERMASWEVSSSGHATLRSGATALIVLWMLVIAGGRWIAYAPI
jgi:hypothetical protein